MYILLFGIEFLFMGLIFVSISFGHKLTNKNLLLKCTSTTTAKFDSIQENYFKDSNTKKSYFPIYKYNVDNIEYCYRGFGQENKDIVNKNDITIYYNPNNPEECYEQFNIRKSEKVIKLFIILGSIFFVIGLALIVLKVIVLK